jgi:hypothetical protein
MGFPGERTRKQGGKRRDSHLLVQRRGGKESNKAAGSPDGGHKWQRAEEGLLLGAT